MQKRFDFTKNFPNGDRYKGEATGSDTPQRDGKGEFFCAATGATYVGEWKADKMNGTGVLTQPGTNGFTYEGRFERGQRGGTGTCVFTDGRKYTGEWKADKMNGNGRLEGSPGADDFTVYEGHMVNNRRNGNGKCTYSNGDVYEGQFVKDERHGQGTLTLAASDASGIHSSIGSSTGSSGHHQQHGPTADVSSPPVWYRGGFIHNCASTGGDGGLASAEIRYADGSTYVGEVQQLHREGEGTHTLASGDVYTGAFRQNHRDGVGTLRCVDGRSYEGSWRRGKMDGRIHFTRSSANGTPDPSLAPRTLVEYLGPCVQGEMTGTGARAVLADGSVYYCEVLKGEPTGVGKLENAPITLSPSVMGDGVKLLLQRYEGPFFNGLPDGDGGVGSVVVVQGLANRGFGCEVLWEPSATLELEGGSGRGVRGFRIGYPKEGTYHGTWRQGVPGGVGRWAWAGTSDSFRGTVIEGGPHGSNGAYEGPSGEVYEGDFVNGQPCGRGIFTFARERIGYNGGWKDGCFDGEGELLMGALDSQAPGQEPYLHCKGNWCGGYLNGHDCLMETRAASYTGDCVNGKRCGYGEVVYQEGRMASYKGPFLNGAITTTNGTTDKDKGTLTLRDGTVIVGHFKDGKLHGTADITFVQGMRFSGTFKSHRMVGEGRIQFPNGDSYVGEVEQLSSSHEWDFTPQRHGKGVYSFVEGGKLQCCWKHNVLHGSGTHTAANGDVTERHYVDGISTTQKVGGSGMIGTQSAEPSADGKGAAKEKVGGSGKSSSSSPKQKQSPPQPQPIRQEGSRAHVFSDENAFPNTLSEEQLKERLQNGSAPPVKRPFLRKGEAKQATTAPSPIGQSGGGGRRPSNTPRATPSGEAQPHPPATNSAAAALLGGASGRRGSRSESGGRGSSTEKRRRGSVPECNPNSRERCINSTGSLPDSSSVLDRFQRGVTHLHNSGDIASEAPSSARETIGSRSNVNSARPTPAPAPQTPLRGPLAKLMREASNIRSSREDEIHLLTEEMRTLNERIWQLRFCISADGKSQLTDAQKSQLREMAAERGTVMAKLTSLVSMPDE